MWKDRINGEWWHELWTVEWKGCKRNKSKYYNIIYLEGWRKSMKIAGVKIWNWNLPNKKKKNRLMTTWPRSPGRFIKFRQKWRIFSDCEQSTNCTVCTAIDGVTEHHRLDEKVDEALKLVSHSDSQAISQSDSKEISRSVIHTVRQSVSHSFSRQSVRQ